MIFFMLILCLSDVITGKPQSSGIYPSCKTPNEENGVCIPLQSCNSLYELEQRTTLFPDELDLLRQSQCNSNQESMVCCADYPSQQQASTTMGPATTKNIVTPPSNTKSTPRISARKCKEYKEFSFDKSYIKNAPGSLYELKSSNCAVICKAVILGGVQVAPKEFPHMALIGYEYEQLKPIDWLCGGSLISEQFVLSAGHCDQNKYVRLGEHDILRTEEGTAIDYDIMERIPHPNYRHPYNDIMLFKLRQIVELNGAIRPICLPEQSFVATDSAIVSGWGFTKGSTLDQRSNVLLKVTLEIFSQSACNDKYSTYVDLTNGIVEDTQMCAGWMTGNKRKDSCKGDSGGPIQILNRDNDDECIYYILGVTSLGPHMCGIKGHPSVYTRVYPYLDWIEKIVWPNE